MRARWATTMLLAGMVGVGVIAPAFSYAVGPFGGRLLRRGVAREVRVPQPPVASKPAPPREKPSAPAAPSEPEKIIPPTEAKEMILRYIDRAMLAQETPWIVGTRDKVAAYDELRGPIGKNTVGFGVGDWMVGIRQKPTNTVELDSEQAIGHYRLTVPYREGDGKYELQDDEAKIKYAGKFPAPEEKDLTPRITAAEVKLLIDGFVASEEFRDSVFARHLATQEVRKYPHDDNMFFYGRWQVHTGWGEGWLFSELLHIRFQFKRVDGKYAITDSSVTCVRPILPRPTPK